MSETQPPRRTLRSIGAVVAGLLIVIILSIGTDAVITVRLAGRQTPRYADEHALKAHKETTRCTNERRT